MFAKYTIRPSFYCFNYASLTFLLRTSSHLRHYVATRNTDQSDFKRIVVLRKTIAKDDKKFQNHVSIFSVNSVFAVNSVVIDDMCKLL